MFYSARLKLTGWYLLIIMCVSVSFSAVIFTVLSREVERFARAQQLRLERRFHQDIIFPQEFSPLENSYDPDLVNETTHRILLMLASVNGIIFIISGGLGFVLAGRTLHPIEKMVDEQNRFISDASHEFRTPITSLKSAFEVSLRDKDLTLREAKTIIKESIDEVNHMQSLSESLLQLAQFESIRNSDQFTKLSISSVIEKAVKKLQPVARKRHINISHNSSDVRISGIENNLVDLFVILIDNAIKYSPDHTNVMLTIRKTENSLAIDVVDHGIGILPKDLPHIFDRFYRADTARSKSKSSGYGIGLSIAKKIAESHNGFIQVKSVPENGSTFTVKLPVV